MNHFNHFILIILAGVLLSCGGCIQYTPGRNTGFGGLVSGLAGVAQRNVRYSDNNVVLNTYGDNQIRVGNGTVMGDMNGFMGYMGNGTIIHNGAGGAVRIPGVGSVTKNGVNIQGNDWNLRF